MPKPSKSRSAAAAKAGNRPAARKAAKRSNPKKRARSDRASARTPSPARPGTKLASLISLLSRKDGATIADLMKATGWQAHSVRGAISGNLKKKLGLGVISEKVEGRGRVYRVAQRG